MSSNLRVVFGLTLLLGLMIGCEVVAGQTQEDTKHLDEAASRELMAGVTFVGKGDSTSLTSAITGLTASISYSTKSGNLTLQANAYFLRGVCNNLLAFYPAAEGDAKKALELYTSTKDATGQFLSSALMAIQFLKLKDDEKAKPYMIVASDRTSDTIFPTLDKEVIKMIGGTYFGVLGDAFARFGDRKRGLDLLWKGYQLTTNGPVGPSIDALVRYAKAQITLKTPKLAVSFFETALQRARDAKLRNKEAEVLFELGDLYINELDDEASARPRLNDALAIADDLKYYSLAYKALIRLGDANVLKVDVGKAFDCFKRANEVAELAQAIPGDRALILYKLSEIQGVLGDSKQSREYEEAALALATNGANKRLEAEIIVNRAFRSLEAAGTDTAMSNEEATARVFKFATQLQAAMELVKDEPDGPEVALGWLGSIAMAAARAGLHQQAIDMLTKVSEQSRTRGYKIQEALATSEIGLAKYLGGDYRGAVNELNLAVSAFRQLGLRGREGLALQHLMMCWSKLNNRSLAIFFGKSAVNRFQEIRQTTTAFTSDQQRTLLGYYENAYRELAKLLIEDGRIAEAEQVLTMLKQEELLQYVRRDDAVAKTLLASVSINDDERAAIGRYEAIAGEITSIGHKMSSLDEERKQFPPEAFPKQAEYEKLKQELADANITFQKFLDELKLKFGQTDTRVAMVDSSLKKILDRLKATHTAAVSTIVGEDTLNIIVTTSKTQRAHTVKVSAASVNALVEDLRKTLTSPQYDPRPASQKLYYLIVKPIEGDLAGIKADTIVWSLDGSLRYIPPAALWDKEKGYLVERFSNVIVNLANRASLEKDPMNAKRLSVLGVGVSKPVEGFAPLAAVPDELDCIVSDKTAGVLSAKPQCSTGLLTGRKLLDEKFTLTSFEGELGRYPIVHIASHFKLVPGDDKNSFLLLGGGTDRKFTVEKLRSESLGDLELMVLSACNTATPAGTKTNGIEVESFSALAQEEARSVIATLWSVSDPSTKDFMVEFYKLYGAGGISKAAAVRQAQLKLMYGKYSPDETQKHRADEFVTATDKSLPKFTPDPNAPFAHPFYWSPFTLAGNWR